MIFSWFLNIPASCLSLARGYPRPVVVSVACSDQEVLEVVPSSPVRSLSSQGDFWILSGSELVYSLVFQSFLLCVSSHWFFFFCKFIFSVEVIASQPVRDSGCQYQKPFLGLDCLCVVLSQFLHRPAACLRLDHGYPRAVEAQHAFARVLYW